MATQIPNPFVLRFWAVAGLALAAVTLYLTVSGQLTYPEQAALKRVSGSVVSVEPDRYGINFRLSGDSRTFFYAQKSGELQLVASVLQRPSAQPLTLLIPEGPQQGLSKRPYFQVHALATPNGVVRSYGQVQKAWSSNYLYGYPVVLFALVAAAYLEWVARRAQPNNSSKPKPLRGSD